MEESNPDGRLSPIFYLSKVAFNGYDLMHLLLGLGLEIKKLELVNEGAIYGDTYRVILR